MCGHLSTINNSGVSNLTSANGMTDGSGISDSVSENGNSNDSKLLDGLKALGDLIDSLSGTGDNSAQSTQSDSAQSTQSDTSGDLLEIIKDVLDLLLQQFSNQENTSSGLTDTDSSSENTSSMLYACQ